MRKALVGGRRVRVTPATVISVVALVLAAGGGAYAGTTSGGAHVAGWAVVSSNGHLSRGSGAKKSALIKKHHRVQKGSYEVLFKSKVSACAYKATIGNTGAKVPSIGDIGVAGVKGNKHAVFVRTTNIKGKGANYSFHLAVVC